MTHTCIPYDKRAALVSPVKLQLDLRSPSIPPDSGRFLSVKFYPRKNQVPSQLLNLFLLSISKTAVLINGQSHDLMFAPRNVHLLAPNFQTNFTPTFFSAGRSWLKIGLRLNGERERDIILCKQQMSDYPLIGVAAFYVT